MHSIIELQIPQFLLIYILLLIVLFLMKKCRINQMKTLVLASMKMTIQLILAGLILSYIFETPNPIFTFGYVGIMMAFSIYRVLSQNKDLNRTFQWVIALSMIFSGFFVIIFFIYIVVQESIMNPQYIIPIAGMVMGNTMTGVSLGIKTFKESIVGQRNKIQALTCMGSDCQTILLPFVRQALETAMLPTINSMVGMGVVSLPGMMTGQILSGTLPMTAILYQIAIMIAICTVVTCACFGSLYFGQKTLYDAENMVLKGIGSDELY